MKLIKINNNSVELAEGVLLVPEFKEIWESNKRETALNIFTYIYMFADYDSVYKELKEEDRKTLLEKDLKVKSNEQIERAIDKFKELTYSFSMRYLDSALKATTKTMGYFDNVDYTLLDIKGNPVYKITEVQRALGDCVKVANSLEDLKKKVQNEQLGNNKIKAGVKISQWEK